MNRRGFLSSIPLFSIASAVPVEVRLREQYMRYIFPSKYNIQSCESEGIKHYDAMYIDSEESVQFHYYWDSKHREHRYRIKVYGEDPLDVHSMIEGVAGSVAEAKEELEEDIVVPNGLK